MDSSLQFMGDVQHQK